MTLQTLLSAHELTKTKLTSVSVELQGRQQDCRLVEVTATTARLRGSFGFYRDNRIVVELAGERVGGTITWCIASEMTVEFDRAVNGLPTIANRPQQQHRDCIAA
jgi:hypothetical protein